MNSAISNIRLAEILWEKFFLTKIKISRLSNPQAHDFVLNNLALLAFTNFIDDLVIDILQSSYKYDAAWHIRQHISSNWSLIVSLFEVIYALRILDS